MVRIAVEGCGHGTLDAIYASVAKSCQVKGWKQIDLLIIGGDFQAVRNSADLNCMAVPVKYREIGDFHKYYSGSRTAPYLTLFVGGNHEASNYLRELYYGGWVAPNIYYMGAASILRFGPLRIAGISGIWKGYNFRRPHYESLPYNQDEVRSIYHVREIDTRKLLQVKSQVDIGISHDWPRGVEWTGDWKRLFARKKHLEPDAKSAQLGSVAAKLVLERLRPYYWFSAHLHAKYAAIIDHGAHGEQDPKKDGKLTAGDSEKTDDINGEIHNAEEIDLDVDSEDSASALASSKGVAVHQALDNTDTEIYGKNSLSNTEEQSQISSNSIASAVDPLLRSQLPESFRKPPREPEPPEPPTTISNLTTSFLALDKCVPNHDFLQLIEIEPSQAVLADSSLPPSMSGSEQEDLVLQYDPEFLAITRAFALHEPLQLGHATTADTSIPRDKGRAHYGVLIDEHAQWVDENITRQGKLAVPHDFELTAPVHDGDDEAAKRTSAVPWEYTNPQTTRFCEMLGIPNPFDATEEERRQRMANGPDETRNGGGGRVRGRGRGGPGRPGRGSGGGRGRGRGRERGRSY